MLAVSPVSPFIDKFSEGDDEPYGTPICCWVKCSSGYAPRTVSPRIKAHYQKLATVDSTGSLRDGIASAAVVLEREGDVAV